MTTEDERKRLVVLVPDPLVRTEVTLWLEAMRLEPDDIVAQACIEGLFAGRLRASVVDGELKFELTERARGDAERAREARP